MVDKRLNLFLNVLSDVYILVSPKDEEVHHREHQPN